MQSVSHATPSKPAQAGPRSGSASQSRGPRRALRSAITVTKPLISRGRGSFGAPGVWSSRLCIEIEHFMAPISRNQFSKFRVDAQSSASDITSQRKAAAPEPGRCEGVCECACAYVCLHYCECESCCRVHLCATQGECMFRRGFIGLGTAVLAMRKVEPQIAVTAR